MAIKITDIYPIPKQLPQLNGPPRGRVGDGRQEAITALEVGQSFWVKASISSASTLRWWGKARFPDREFTARAERNGVRIWRTK